MYIRMYAVQISLLNQSMQTIINISSYSRRKYDMTIWLTQVLHPKLLVYHSIFLHLLVRQDLQQCLTDPVLLQMH